MKLKNIIFFFLTVVIMSCETMKMVVVSIPDNDSVFFVIKRDGGLNDYSEYNSKLRDSICWISFDKKTFKGLKIDNIKSNDKTFSGYHLITYTDGWFNNWFALSRDDFKSLSEIMTKGYFTYSTLLTSTDFKSKTDSLHKMQNKYIVNFTNNLKSDLEYELAYHIGTRTASNESYWHHPDSLNKLLYASIKSRDIDTSNIVINKFMHSMWSLQNDSVDEGYSARIFCDSTTALTLKIDFDKNSNFQGHKIHSQTFINKREYSLNYYFW